MDQLNHSQPVNTQAQVYKWSRAHLYNVLSSGKKPILTQPELLAAFQLVDRARFIPATNISDAYNDIDLEVGFGQILDSPVTIAHMLSALQLESGAKVLDLGTGSGYVAALLSQIVGSSGKVYSLERNQQLASIARQKLAPYEINHNTEIVFTDGTEGLLSRAPFDAIYVGFAYAQLPHSLIEQLAIGANIVVPLTSLQIKLIKRISVTEFQESIIAIKHFTKLIPGVE